MLKINNLNANIDNKSILKGFSLNVNPGEVHAIMGPDGSGKSTLSNILSGKKGYDVTGEVLFENNNLFDLETEERAQLNFSSSNFSSLAFSFTSFKNSIASSSFSPRAFLTAFNEVLRKMFVLTPGISNGYWNAKKIPDS